MNATVGQKATRSLTVTADRVWCYTFSAGR